MSLLVMAQTLLLLLVIAVTYLFGMGHGFRIARRTQREFWETISRERNSSSEK